METIEHIDSLDLWIPFSLLVGIALAIDLGLFRKVSSKFKGKHSAQEDEFVNTKNEHKSGFLWTIIWVSLAGLFALLILKFMGSGKGLISLLHIHLKKPQY